MARQPALRGQVMLHMGFRLTTRRIEAELTLDDVASFLGRPVPDVEAIEAGRASLSAEDVVELSLLLQVPPSWFFEGLI